MTLHDINEKWIAYKKEYGSDSDVLIGSLSYDAPKGVEASFDITELYSGSYILHLNKDIHVSRGEFVDFVLWHEFTHLDDFLTQPFSYKILRKLYLFMNTYSEYHASRRSLDRIMKRAFPNGINPEKNVIPMAYRDISIRKLVDENLQHAAGALAYFRKEKGNRTFQVYLRFIMYLMGYVSHFLNGRDILTFCLNELGEDPAPYLALYDLCLKKDFYAIPLQVNNLYKMYSLKEEA